MNLEYTKQDILGMSGSALIEIHGREKSIKQYTNFIKELTIELEMKKEKAQSHLQAGREKVYLPMFQDSIASAQKLIDVYHKI